MDFLSKIAAKRRNFLKHIFKEAEGGERKCKQFSKTFKKHCCIIQQLCLYQLVTPVFFLQITVSGGGDFVCRLRAFTLFERTKTLSTDILEFLPRFPQIWNKWGGTVEIWTTKIVESPLFFPDLETQRYRFMPIMVVTQYAQYITKQSQSLFTGLESEWKYCRFAMYWANCVLTVILPWFYLQKAPLSLQRLSEKTRNHRSELLLKYHRFAKFLLKYQDFRSTPHPPGGRPWPRGGKSTVLKPYGYTSS